jgi:RNA polymerase sigma-70 factor (ECF subfamily)
MMGNDEPRVASESIAKERYMEPTVVENPLPAFVSAKPRLFGIAYRMLGSAAEAEDVVQDVWLRWQSCDRSVVLDAGAYLATMTTRLAINVAQSARARRETYVGPWRPEPVDTRADPALGAERGQALELAVLVLLEKLSPVERAAYVLREAFDYPYRQIAEILRQSEENARQLVSRARKHIAEGRRAPVAPAEQRRLLDAFLAAAQKGDLAALEGMLTADVVSYSDGGGVVHAAGLPITGRTAVARFITAFSGHYWTGLTLEWIEANGQWCVLLCRDGVAVGLATIDASEEGIGQVLWVMRPSKLSGVRRGPRGG